MDETKKELENHPATPYSYFSRWGTHLPYIFWGAAECRDRLCRSVELAFPSFPLDLSRSPISIIPHQNRCRPQSALRVRPDSPEDDLKRARSRNEGGKEKQWQWHFAANTGFKVGIEVVGNLNIYDLMTIQKVATCILYALLAITSRSVFKLKGSFGDCKPTLFRARGGVYVL